jgi:hypothetical protein
MTDDAKGRIKLSREVQLKLQKTLGPWRDIDPRELEVPQRLRDIIAALDASPGQPTAGVAPATGADNPSVEQPRKPNRGTPG